MDEERIIETLRHSGEPVLYRRQDCLPPELLAAYRDGALCGSTREEAETHLAECDYCLEQLASIVQSEEGAEPDSNSASVPPALVARAERLGKATRPRTVTTGSHWAIAAVLALAIGLVALQLTPPSAPETALPERQTRLADPQALQPQLLAPKEGSVITPLEQVFHWSAVPGSLFYDVRLIDGDGNLLLRERVEDTRWLIPEEIQLQAGEEYYVRIDAYLSDAKYLSSEHVVFTVGGAN